MFGRAKKLKKIPYDLVSYIQIETEAIKTSNDKMMISSYCLHKLEIVKKRKNKKKKKKDKKSKKSKKSAKQNFQYRLIEKSVNTLLNTASDIALIYAKNKFSSNHNEEH